MPHKSPSQIPLIPYQQDHHQHQPQPQPLPNLGNTCYFNSIIQCLLSCPSIFITIEQSQTTNKFITLLYKLYQGQNTIHQLYSEFIAISNKRNDNVKLSYGQQDAHEALMIIFDEFEQIDLPQQFLNIYKSKIYCDNCKSYTSEKINKDLYITIAETLTAKLNKHISKNINTIEDYQCPTCDDKNIKYKINSLIRLSSIIPIIFNKYINKNNIDFPQYLTFNHSSGKKIVYQLVAQCEHSGSRHGGHYYTICTRQSKTYQIDDLSISPATFKPTKQTYIIFYHYIGLQD